MILLKTNNFKKYKNSFREINLLENLNKADNSSVPISMLKRTISVVL